MDKKKKKESPPSTMQIRAAVRDDLKNICTLEAEIFPETDRFSRRQFKYLLTSSKAMIFIAHHHAIPIGYGIALIKELRNKKIQGRIYSIGISPKSQSKGSGTQLLEAMEKWLIKKKSDHITLETRSDKYSAENFYLKNGYVSVKILPKYYKPAVNGIRMVKSIVGSTNRTEKPIISTSKQKA